MLEVYSMHVGNVSLKDGLYFNIKLHFNTTSEFGKKTLLVSQSDTVVVLIIC